LPLLDLLLHLVFDSSEESRECVAGRLEIGIAYRNDHRRSWRTGSTIARTLLDLPQPPRIVGIVPSLPVWILPGAALRWIMKRAGRRELMRRKLSFTMGECYTAVLHRPRPAIFEPLDFEGLFRCWI
jgi:hypothetical protein